MVTTRAHSYDQEKSSDILATEASNSFEPAEETLFERRSRWAALLHAHDYRTVITEVLEQELLKYSTSTLIIPTSLSSIMSECVLILASAPLIFAAAVDGTLTQQYLDNTALQIEYALVQERAHVQPSIYIHLLADEHGVAPTANQYMQIREAVIKYIDIQNLNNELAFQIDNISVPPFPQLASRQGHRKYLSTAARTRSPARILTLQRLCAGILRRWTETSPHNHNTPLPFPPGECGYALHSHSRLAQHCARQSSNYVMNLVEDICTYLYTTNVFTQRFSMHQFIIYLIFRPSQAAIAEIFCSGLLQVWVDNGGGFNHYPAGRSNRSAERVAEEAWSEAERFAREGSGLVGNLRLQREGMDSVVGNLNEGVARLWMEVLDLLQGFGEDEGV